MQEKATQLIKKYYDAFNHNDMETFFSLLDDNVLHDINQGNQQVGKNLFKNFMDHMNQCYQEKIRDLVIMSNTAGTRAAAEFIVDGVYLSTDQGLPLAHHQKYSLPAGAFFEIAHDKIKRVTVYYNLQDWLKQVSK